MSARRFLNNLILHARPTTVPEKSLRFNLTWGLGGIALAMILILLLTGILLKFSYDPYPGRAYESILTSQSQTVFGQLTRNLHHWSATGVILVAFLHLLRVFFTSAYQTVRGVNWLIGLFLFGLLVLSNFTGYLLPWDQLSYWAITVCVGLLEYLPLVGGNLLQLIQGGEEIGPKTLSLFYVIHTVFLPILLLIGMSYHFWKIRKAGGIVIARFPGEEKSTAREDRVSTVPHLLVREITTAVILVAVMLLISMFFNAPLGDKANPGLSPNPSKAPWYFMGFQELLMHLHPVMVVLVIPLLLVLLPASIPFIPGQTDAGGIWFISGKGRKSSLVAALSGAILTLLFIIGDELFFDFSKVYSGSGSFFSAGLLPVLILALILLTSVWGIKRTFSLNRSEWIQTVFIFGVVAFIILTISGVYFRGENMALILFRKISG